MATTISRTTRHASMEEGTKAFVSAITSQEILGLITSEVRSGG